MFEYGVLPVFPTARHCLRFLAHFLHFKFVYFRCGGKQVRMSAALQLELQALHSCVDETDADRAREIVGNVAQICLTDISQRNIGCDWDTE